MAGKRKITSGVCLVLALIRLVVIYAVVVVTCLQVANRMRGREEGRRGRVCERRVELNSKK